MVDAEADEEGATGRPPMPTVLRTARRLQTVGRFDGVRRIAYELGTGRAIDNARREIEVARIAMARVEALARRVPPTAGESSPEMVRSA
jgi:hypothetical protein